MLKIKNYILIFFLFLFNSKTLAETITMPSSLTADTTGFDWNFNNGWNLSSTLDKIDNDGFGHQNYLKFNAFKTF